MSINTAVNIDVNVDGTQTVKQAAMAYEDLGDAFAKTQREAEAMALQYGLNDERTQEAIKTAGRYKQQLEQLDQAIDANRGGMETLFRATQGVTAGFQVATGAMALFGSESEELNKILVKVQGAMAFSQGLKDLKEFAPAIKQVNGQFLNMIKTLKGVKLALAATGIGAIVAVIGLFGEQIGKLFDKLADKFKGFTDSLGLTQFALNDLINAQKETVAVGERQLAVLEAQGASEEEIYRKKVENANAVIRLRELELQKLKEGEDGYTDAVTALKDAQNQIAVLDASETKRLADVQAERIAQEKAKEEERQKFLADKAQQYASAADTFLNQTQRKREKDLKEWYEKELNLVIGNMEAEGNLFDLYYKKRKQQEEDFRNERRLGLAEQLNDTVSFLQVLGDLATTYAGEDEKKAKQAFQINKQVSTAEAIVNTYTGATAALASKTELYPYERFVKAALVISTGLAQVAKIQRTQYRSTNVNGGGNISSVSVPTTLRASSVNVGNEFVTADRRVYVLQGDITRTINNVNNTRAVSVVE